MTTVVALLRGINLGSRRRVAMADLRELVGSLGHEDVRTHLQSGNVVFSSSQAPADAAQAIERAIVDRFGLAVDVIVRTAAELDEVVAANPFDDVADDGSRYFVVFLSDDAEREQVGALAAQDFAPGLLRARGRELYAWCPDGMRDSRLMRTITRGKIAPTATVRNWNTVTKLLEIARSSEKRARPRASPIC